MSDTSLSAARLQLTLQRNLTGEQRLSLAFEMSRLARQLLLARLHCEHPDWSHQQLQRELLRLAFLSEDTPGKLPPPLR